MKRSILLLLLVLAIIDTSFSQYQANSLLYKISEKEYIDIYQGLKLPEQHLHTLAADSDLDDEEEEDHSRHYILAYPEGEYLKTSLVSNPSFTIHVLPLDQQSLVIQVIDTLGLVIENATVWKGKKQFHYHKVSKTYRLKKSTEEEMTLLIRVNKELSLFEVDRYQYGTCSTIFRAWLEKTSYKISWKWRRMKNRLRSGNFWAKRKQTKTYKGYIAFNQPKFRPNDTLKIKGYLTNHRGKPLKQPLQLQLKHRHLIKFEQTVYPIEQGVYLAEIPLSDSLDLRLDQSYTISFVDQQKEVKAHNFYYEDYQLEEVNYSLSSNKKNYKHGEKIMLKMDGKFSTGQYIPDGTVQLTVRTKCNNRNFNYRHFLAKEVLLKDTIWRIEQTLSNAKPTQLFIPLDSIPKIAANLYIEAVFSNSNGEIQEKYLSIALTNKLPENKGFQLSLEEEYIIGTATVDSFNNKKMTLDLENYVMETTKSFQLPFKEKVNGYVDEYTLRDKKSSNYVSLKLRDFPSLVKLTGEHTGQQLQLQFSNPRQLPIHYQLYQGKKKVEDGVSDLDNSKLVFDARLGAAYILEYQYIWAGETKIEQATFKHSKKQLQIVLEQASEVIPGTPVSIKVKVKDFRQKNVQGVNLTAGSVNQQFASTQSFSPINLAFKSAFRPKVEESGIEVDWIDFFDVKNAKKLPLTKSMVQKLGIDKKLYYRLRHPDAGIFMQYDSLIKKEDYYKEIAQFAPYVVQRGQMQPIYMIYCNHQLVYYYDVQDNPPYAFIGKEGYNSIQIRTLDQTFFIDSIFLKKGHKLEFSIDATAALPANSKIKVRREPATPFLSPAERELIKNTTFALQLKADFSQLTQGKHNIHRLKKWIKQGSIIRLGPFISNQTINLTTKNGDNQSILFTPGYSYQINKNQERLTSYNCLKEPHWLPTELAQKELQQLVYSPNDIEKITKRFSKPLFFEIPYSRKKPKGTIQFYIQQHQQNIMAVLWKPKNQDTYTLQPYIRKIRDIEGTYNLLIVRKDSTYIEQEVQVKPNTLLFLNLSEETFKRDTAHTILKQMGVAPGAGILTSQQTNQTGTLQLSFKKKTNQIAMTHTISGTITDEEGEALIGASVLVVGTTSGTVSDIDGNYTLAVPKGSFKLQIAYTGYATKELKARGTTGRLDVSMEEGLDLLSEVVVTAIAIVDRSITAGYATNELKARGTTGRLDVCMEEGLQLNEVVLTAGRGIVERSITSSTIETSALQDDQALNNLESLAMEQALLHKDLFANGTIRSNFKDHAFWEPNLRTDKNGEAYFTATFPDNFTQWSTFVIGMDQRQRAGIGYATTNAFKPLIAQLSVPRFLIEGDEAVLIGKAINFTEDTIGINTAFKTNQEITQTNSTELTDVLIEHSTITAPLQADSISFTYQLSSKNQTDGEQRRLPIFKKGITETVGSFHLLNKDTILELLVDDPKKPVTIRIESNKNDLLQQNIDYLIQYPYGCNEQTSSKLLAVLLAQKLKKQQGLPFEKEDYILKGIQRLDKAQNPNGSWGWWKDGKANIWMTTYVLNALHQAKEAGYRSVGYETGLFYLVNQLPNLANRDLLNVLALCSSIELEIAFEPYLAKLDTTFVQPDLHSQLTILKIKQAQDLPHSLNVLYKNQQLNHFGSPFWGSSRNHWYNTYTQTTLLAYEILQKAGETALCADIEAYLLRQKDKNGWTNTFQTAKVLSVLLDHATTKQPQSNQVDSLLFGTDSIIAIPSYPFLLTVDGDQLIRLKKSGTNAAYVSTSQTYFNPTPKPKSDIFEISTQLIQKGNTLRELEAATPTQLSVTIDVKRHSEYVMIEVPIPAGCSYGDKQTPAYWRNWKNREVHRSYFKEKVAIFCEELPIGSYTYTIDLEPRFTGQYTLNPAKVEEMYFPVFYGRNEGENVRIVE